ncbi:MAG: SDR family NAD(P)-dependent oxidoreductase [Xanthomonadaceae bacterium]|nr:SDR family NAD(P)-dependent oxidoreductase [Xanthomonadaceae bacterium]MDZ4376881.1 SDR family NAD(P)-dependent oxidoreductase [Xanthomonadaceae bacterium]
MSNPCRLFAARCAVIAVSRARVAGIQHVAPIDEFPPAKWDAIIAINLSSAFHTTRLALPAMKKKGWAGSSTWPRRMRWWPAGPGNEAGGITPRDSALLNAQLNTPVALHAVFSQNFLVGA